MSMQSDDELILLNQFFIQKKASSELLAFLQGQIDPDQVYVAADADDKLAQLHDATSRISQNEGIKKFEACEDQVRVLNRIAEEETRWIVYPLYVVCHQLIKQCKDKKQLEECGRVIHRSFNLCLNDRNPVEHENRRNGSMSFANLEFLIYHKLQNRDMMKNLVKVLQTRVDLRQRLDLKSHYVWFNYYMGEYYGCYENDYQTGFKYLFEALLNCQYTARSGKKSVVVTIDPKVGAIMSKICVLLIPFAILSHKVYPNVEFLHKTLQLRYFPTQIFEKMIHCLLSGDVRSMDALLKKSELYFLESRLYVAMCHIRELVFLKFFKKCCRVIMENNEASKRAIVSLIPIATVYKPIWEGMHSGEPLIEGILDHLECSIANLITKGYVKGYLSHSNRCIVLSKNDAFPKLSRSVADTFWTKMTSV